MLKTMPTKRPEHHLWRSLELLVAGHLRCLDGADLGEPADGRLDFAHGAELIGGIARDADVVDTLKHELDIADLENLGATLLGDVAGRVKERVDERVGHGENGLRWISQQCEDGIESLGKGEGFWVGWLPFEKLFTEVLPLRRQESTRCLPGPPPAHRRPDERCHPASCGS